jgi:hypothetical protein
MIQYRWDALLETHRAVGGLKAGTAREGEVSLCTTKLESQLLVDHLRRRQPLLQIPAVVHAFL